jgi:hypothetical protein
MGWDGLPGYGGARIKFHYPGVNGHLTIQITVYESATDAASWTESTTLQIASVPAAIDSFIHALRSMALKIGESACLGGER